MSTLKTSATPHLLKGYMEWFAENGIDDVYIQVKTDQINHPTLREMYPTQQQFRLNIGPRTTRGLTVDKDGIHFNTYLNKVKTDVDVPLHALLLLEMPGFDSAYGVFFGDAEIYMDEEEGPKLQAVDENNLVSSLSWDPTVDTDPRNRPKGPPTLRVIK